MIRGGQRGRGRARGKAGALCAPGARRAATPGPPAWVRVACEISSGMGGTAWLQRALGGRATAGTPEGLHCAAGALQLLACRTISVEATRKRREATGAGFSRWHAFLPQPSVADRAKGGSIALYPPPGPLETSASPRGAARPDLLQRNRAASGAPSYTPMDEGEPSSKRARHADAPAAEVSGARRWGPAGAPAPLQTGRGGMRC